ncbi:PHP domain-containing protein [Planotetraspora sp. A-T 1434]|uniref:PHP domain-containing protein n=1 Tax=Planotetraspora sp. A-T 1434 TaxID=2979219 RepID=UPI0021BE0EFB|nr:PHP domain-containing protein [Planotetraspora sp. A-T 1434]MCT9935235.1 PHP domain-containing protein [Planotetraspora sp. A-T 1434]
MSHGHAHPHDHSDDHDHSHDHSHDHGHSHDDGHGQALTEGDMAPVVDMSVPDAELSPGQLSRRQMFRRAGLLGAGLTAAGVLGAPRQAAAETGRGDDFDRFEPRDGYLWLAGDHHIHTQHSSDGMYRVIDHVQHANAYGLDWMVITDHGSVAHAKIGVDKVNPDIVAARQAVKDTLVFQGLEWNIPAAEHGTVFVAPGRNEVATLKEFENAFDGAVKNATASTPQNEALAIAGLNFLADAVKQRRVDDALFLANHPARKGIDSPHEIRGWRDAQPSIAVGMEGAPGHQAAGIPKPNGGGSGRGFYDNSPSADSFPGYPAESYKTFGGFDWMTATVGGLWDSLLAEGKTWWITANSDSHTVYGDASDRGPNSDFNANGRYNDPIYKGVPNLSNGDFWPGFYSRTHVGARGFSYGAVMEGIRQGRIWVDHGGLINGLVVRARTSDRRGVTLGGTLYVRQGAQVEVSIEITLANRPNWAQFVPALARVDVIQGDVTGPASDKDVFTTPATKVVQSFEVGKNNGTVTFTYNVGAVDRPVYVRLRGTDGNRGAPGLLGAGVDPHGPQIDVFGDADPWKDLWFYSNPIWILPRR